MVNHLLQYITTHMGTYFHCSAEFMWDVTFEALSLHGKFMQLCNDISLYATPGPMNHNMNAHKVM
jgi:hypothetical protein